MPRPCELRRLRFQRPHDYATQRQLTESIGSSTNSLPCHRSSTSSVTTWEAAQDGVKPKLAVIEVDRCCLGRSQRRRDAVEQRLSDDWRFNSHNDRLRSSLPTLLLNRVTHMFTTSRVRFAGGTSDRRAKPKARAMPRREHVEAVPWCRARGAKHLSPPL